jgi:glycosyltransferase involved in cell wall biosynthesis
VKVLLTADPYLPVPPTLYGGIERIVGTLIVKLRRRGHTVGLVAHPESTTPADYFVGWPSTQPNSTIAHVQNSLTLLKAVRDFDPSLLHSYSRLAYLSPLLMKKLPKVMSYQRHTGGHQIRIGAAFAGQSLAFTGCSDFIANMGRRFGGAWYAIPNFVDVDLYKASTSVADDAPLVFLSRIEHTKGPHLAIEVAKKTGRRLLIAGNYAEHGPERQYWESVIRPELGRNRIDYVGPVDDPAKVALLQSALAMIVPIQWDEPFGIVFVESLACGTPVISCPRGALPEIIRNGVDGFLVYDKEGACKAVHNLYQIDRRECRFRAETSFSAEVISGRYESLYQSLVQI